MESTPKSITIENKGSRDDSTVLSDSTSKEDDSSMWSRKKKTGESLLIADWVRESLFKFCKFVTSDDMMDYGEPLCLYALEGNNIKEDKEKWWKLHKKDIGKTLSEKRNSVIDSIKLEFKSKFSENDWSMCECEYYYLEFANMKERRV